MSDETKTKLEGDDAITLAMVNVWRSTMGRAPYTSSEWAKWPEERSPAMVALSWVRANLVAPAVAEAQRHGMELSQETINVLQADRDKLRALADEWNSKACALQHQLNRANDCLAAEKVRAENLAKGLREANRLCTDYVGEIRELRAKVAELEATLATPAPAALPQVGEMVEVRLRGIPEFGKWERATVTDHGFVAKTLDLLGLSRALGDEGEDWRRVQPQPAQLPKVGETVFMLPTAAVRDIAKPARVLYHWPSGRGFNSVDDDGSESPCRDTHEGINWSRTMPQPSDHEPECGRPGCTGHAPGHCPRCDSPAPNLHPAVQEGGEVQPCSHQYHNQPPWQPSETESPSEPPPEDVATHVSCPACGSFNLRTEPALREIRFPSGNLRPVPIWQDTCLVCGQVGDFADRNDALIEKVLSIPEPAKEVKDVATPELDAVFNMYVNNHLLGTLAKPIEERIKAAYRRDLASAIARETERLRKRAKQQHADMRKVAHAVGVCHCADHICEPGPIEAVLERLRQLVLAETERDDLRRQLREHAGECAVCGGGLHDRSSFPVHGVRVCGDCAQQSQSKLEAAIDARRVEK